MNRYNIDIKINDPTQIINKRNGRSVVVRLSLQVDQLSEWEFKCLDFNARVHFEL